jgi:hypothetical protein
LKQSQLTLIGRKKLLEKHFSDGKAVGSEVFGRLKVVAGLDDGQKKIWIIEMRLFETRRRPIQANSSPVSLATIESYPKRKLP